MTSGTVGVTTLFSQPWENVFNLIDTRSIINDPREPGNIKSRTFVYRKHPHPEARGNILNFLPYIVVNAPKMRNNEKSVNGELKYIEWECTIEVRSSGSDRYADGKGRTDFYSIIDDLLTLNNKTNQNILRGYGMMNPKLVVTTTDFGNEHGEDVFIAECEFSFRTFKRLSS